MSFQKYHLHKKRKQLMTFDMNYETIIQKNLLEHYVQTTLQTINEMMIYRNIQPNYLSKYNDIEISTVIENESFFLFQVNDTISIIYLLDRLNDKMSKTLSKIISKTVKHVIFVVDNDLKEDKLNDLFVNYEMWNINELMYNIAKHDYVPKHEIVKDEHVDEILNTYNITVEELPGIRVNDPMARYVGAKAGQLIRIHRKSKNMGESIVYRYCNWIIDDDDDEENENGDHEK